MSSKRNRHLTTLALVAVTIALLALSVWRTQERIAATAPRAVIIDPLSGLVTERNFTAEATSLLESNGYRVQTYTGDEVTVDQLKQLPAGSDLLILRVHSGVFDDGVWFFTSEEYDGSKYVLDQLSGEVHIATCPNDPRLLFAVGSRFVEHYMADEFDGCLVLLMGCDGLTTDDLGSAFIDAGAEGVVGWDGAISLDSSDEAVLGLLEAYLGGGDIAVFVGGVGFVDVYDSSLCFYTG